MQKYADVVLDKKGNVVPGATVLVKTSADTNAVLYAGNGHTPISNPLLTDDFGRFAFYAVNDRYSLQVYVGDALYTIMRDVLLEDPLELTPENIQGGVIRDAALFNVTIDGKAPGYKADTDALAVRATSLENRAGSLEGRTGAVEGRVTALELSQGGVTLPPVVENRLAALENGATVTSGRVNALEGEDDALDARISSLQSSMLQEAPVNDKSYARRNRGWIALPPDVEFWDASVYLPTVTLGPSSRIVELYPRLNLSRAVLSNCFVRRAVPASENLTLLLKPTSGADWTATCIIPAGQREGFFTSGNIEPMDSSQGFYIVPSPLPVEAVTGLSITLRFQIEVEQTISLLSVPQPLPSDTLAVFGTAPGQNVASVNLRNLDNGALVMSQDAGGDIATYMNASATQNGVSIVYVKANSDLIYADMRTGLTTSSKVDAIERKGASVNKDATRVLTAEFRSGKWWAVAYTLPAMTVVAQEVDLSLYGVTTVNSIKYSPNDRYIMVGHPAGALVLNALTLVPLDLTSPPTGNVLEVDMTASIYAVLSRKVNDFTLHITTNGQLMTRTGPTAFTEITCSAFNWFTDVPSPYPYFVVGGLTATGWEVVPYSASDFAYQELTWKINFGERIVALAYSEAYTVDEQITESVYGRALAVFGEHGYKVYDLQTGIEIGAQAIGTFGKVTGGFWKSVPGVFE